MANEHEIVLQPTISTVVSDNKNLISSLKALEGKYKLYVDLDFDSNKVDKLVSDLQSKINKASKTIKFSEFEGAQVTLKNISAVTAEKLKQTLADQQLLANEKLRATTEQNNARIDIANSRARIQLKSEEIKIAKLFSQEAEKAAKKEATITKFNKTMSAKVDALKLKGLSDSDISALDAFKEKINAISNETANASVQMDVLKREFAGLSDIINRGKVVDLNLSGRTNIGELQSQLSNLYDGQVIIKQLNDEVVKGGNIWRTFSGEVKNADGTFTKLKGSINGSSGEVRVLESEVQKTNNATINLGESVKRLFTYFISFQQIIRILKDGVGIVQELDNQMNALRMVTGGNEQQTAQMLKTYQQLATQLSSTTLEVAKSADVWLRQGRSIDETNKLIETSQVFSKVAFVDSAQAAKLLTSAINGYQLSVEEAMSVVDKMTAIDMAAATGADDLAIALAETASSAKLAGVSLDAMLAYIGTVSDVTQATAQTIGNSFSSMFARMSSVKLGAELDEFGEDVSRVETVLKQYNITLRDTPATFRNLEDVIKDVALAWDDWSSAQQREVATQIAGKQQMENFLVLMGNWSKATELQAVSLNSAGSAMERFNIYQESTAAKLSELSNQWQIFWSKSIDSSLVKGFIDAGTGLIKLLDNMGNVLLITAGALLVFKRAAVGSGLETLYLHALYAGDAIKALLTKILALISGTKASAAAQLASNAAMNAGAISATALSVAFGAILIAIPLIAMGINSANQAQKEMRQRMIDNADAAKEEVDSLNQLVKKYKELKESEYIDSGTRTEIKNVQEEITKLVKKQAENLNLVNGGLDDELSKLREIALQRAKNAQDSYVAAMTAAKEASSSATGDQSALFGIIGGYDYVGGRDKAAEKIWEEAGYNSSSSFTKGAMVADGGFFGSDLFISTMGDATERAETLGKMLELLKNDADYDYTNSKLFATLQQQYEDYLKYSETIASIAEDIAHNATLISSLEMDNSGAVVNSVESYNAYRDALIQTASEHETLKNLLDEGTISFEDIKSSVDDLMATNFPEWYEQVNQAANDTNGAIAKSASELYDAFAKVHAAYEEGSVESEEYTDSLKKQLAEIERLIHANPTLAASYKNVADILRNEIATAPDTLKKLRDATLDVVNSAYTLSDAFKEQHESGSLSLATALKLIDAGYAAALSIDSETGAVTINTQAYLQLAQAKIEEQIASLKINRDALKSKLENETTAVNNLANAYYLMGEEAIKAALKEAKARQTVTESELKAKEVEIAALENLKGNLGKVSVGNYKPYSSSGSGGSKGSSAKTDKWLQEYETQLAYLKFL